MCKYFWINESAAYRHGLELAPNGVIGRQNQDNHSRRHKLSFFVIVVATTYPNSCKKLSANKSDNPFPGVLSVVLTVDSSKCSNLWWIILASVLGGVFFLAVGLAILVATNAKVGSVFRPFSKRTKEEGHGD